MMARGSFRVRVTGNENAGASEIYLMEFFF